MKKVTEFRPKLTLDGSYTFFSPEFTEAFHSHYGAAQEAEKKFVEPALLKNKALMSSQPSSAELRILDICYGLGYNSAAALAGIWSVNPRCKVELIALEIDINVPVQAVKHDLLERWQQPIPQLLTQLVTERKIHTDYLDASLLIGDARKTIQQIYLENWQADAIFLDPFSPPKCPQLWTVEFLDLVAKCLKPTGRIVTYSSAAAVRTALSDSGLQIGSTPSFGRKSPGTVANFDGRNLPPLSCQEQEHRQTRAAIPYRDPQLQDTAENIHQKRKLEQQNCNLESTSQWKKRWYSSLNFMISGTTLK